MVIPAVSTTVTFDPPGIFHIASSTQLTAVPFSFPKMTSNDVIEWTIDNISCLDRRVHGDTLKSPRRYGMSFPTFSWGLRTSRLRVQYEDIPVESGRLCFINSAGSLISGPHKSENDSIGIIFDYLPNLEELVALARVNNELHGDFITLKFDFSGPRGKGLLRCVRTQIDVYDTTLRIPGPLFNHNQPPFHISTIEYPRCNTMKRVSVFVSKDENSTIHVSFQPLHFEKPVLVSTHISVVSDSDGTRTVENENVFYNATQWEISTPITSNEAKDKNFLVILRVKIVPQNVYNFFYSGHNKKAILHLYPSLNINSCSNPTPQTVPCKNTADEENSIARDFMHLFKEQDFTDFQLKCGDASFPVHRNILGARSPVFKTMLSNDMIEASSGSMEIEDLDPATLGLFLTFIYAGSVDDLQWDSALKLFYAADKYQVSSLKAKCSRVLRGELSVSNVCDLLSLADKHQSRELASVGHGFVLENIREVVTSERWKKFMEDEPLLAAKIFTLFAERDFV